MFTTTIWANSIIQYDRLNLKKDTWLHLLIMQMEVVIAGFLLRLILTLKSLHYRLILIELFHLSEYLTGNLFRKKVGVKQVGCHQEVPNLTQIK